MNRMLRKPVLSSIYLAWIIWHYKLFSKVLSLHWLILSHLCWKTFFLLIWRNVSPEMVFAIKRKIIFLYLMRCHKNSPEPLWIEVIASGTKISKLCNFIALKNIFEKLFHLIVVTNDNLQSPWPWSICLPIPISCCHHIFATI